MITLSDKCCVFITDKLTSFKKNNVSLSVQIQEELRSNLINELPLFYEINLDSISDSNLISSHFSNLDYIRNNFDTTVYILLGADEISKGLDNFKYESSLRRILLDLSYFEFDCYVSFPSSGENYSEEEHSRTSKIRYIVTSVCGESFEEKFYITYMYDDKREYVSNLFLIKKSIASHFIKVNKIPTME